MVISRTKQDQGFSNPGFLGQDFAEFRDEITLEFRFQNLMKKSRGNPFQLIYPSQRQKKWKLEILIQNFENFQIFKILEKNSQIKNFFSKFPKPKRGRQ